MRVLAFASQKSGAGKTMLAGHIAVQAQRSGTESVVLLDADPDGSLADWFSLREEDELQVEQASGKDVLAKLQELRDDGVDLVVIDTPPMLLQSIDDSIGAADLVAIPTRPWAHDVAAAGATVELVQSHGKPFVFVVNGVAPDGELSHEVIMGLAQHGPVATVSIPRSLAVIESMLVGQTVMDLPDSPSPASEVARLWDYLEKRLVKTGLVAAQAPPAAASGPEQLERPAAADDIGAALAPSPASEHATAVAVEPKTQAHESAPSAPSPMTPAPSAPPPAAPAPTAAPPSADVVSPEALRRYPRFKYEQPAVLVVNDKPLDCLVHDISAGGALVIVVGEVNVGDHVTLSLDSIGKLQAEVRHRDGDRAGLRFIVDPKQQLFLVKHLSAVIASASTTVQNATMRPGADQSSPGESTADRNGGSGWSRKSG